MALEDELKKLTAALEENTAALRETLAAAGCASTPDPTPKKPGKKQAKAKEPEPEPEKAEEEAPESEPEKAEEEAPAAEDTKHESGDDRPQMAEFEDPIDTPTQPTGPNAEAVITEITETWKAKMLAADADGKAALKEEFPKLREKWGLGPDDKLIALKDKPENLVGLLDDIKAL